MQKMDASSDQIERLLAEHVSKHPCWRELAGELPDICEAISTALLEPGKRLRPRLFLLAAKGYGLTPLPAYAAVIVALELAHTFVLTHDDLMDCSLSRRGGPSLHARLSDLFAARQPDAFTGADAALVAGDLLYTLAINTLLDVHAPEDVRLQAVRLFTHAAWVTARGALREIALARLPMDQVSYDMILETYRLKTARYTFELPLMLAALFAGRDKELAAPIQTFADSAGQVFQLLNDYNALIPWIEGGAMPDDIRDRRRTPALLYAWQQADTTARRELFNGDGPALQCLFTRVNTPLWLRERILEQTTLARQALPALNFTADATQGLHAMLCPCFT